MIGKPSSATDVPHSVPSVAAVIVTHNRWDSLTAVLGAMSAQVRPPDAIVVVDSGSSQAEYAELASRRGESLTLLRYEDNIGPAAGRGIGLAWAETNGYELVWLVDDDSFPYAEALRTMCDVLERLPGVGMLGLRGGILRAGLLRHGKARGRLLAYDGGDVMDVDFALLDGALIRTPLVAAVGVPRPDFFIMLEDVEYPLRARQAGYQIAVLTADLVELRHAGSSSPGALTAWRGYYQARNYVRMALDLGRYRMLFGVLVRELHFLLRHAGRRGFGPRARLRWRGLSDGFHGRMGRRLDPPSPDVLTSAAQGCSAATR